MNPEDLNDFLDYITDIKGYLVALQVNYFGIEERIAPHVDLLNKVGKEDVKPEDFFQMLLELRGVLGVIVTVFPNTEREILPCVKVIDELREMFRIKLNV